MVYLNYQDRDQVKNYLNYKLSKNTLFRGYSFYKNLCNLYEHYPNTIKDIILNIPKITYYKDYFRILNVSKNEELNEYIYDILLTQIKKDIMNYKEKKKISTLAKWLPRKGREFDRKLDFVNKFSEKMFPIPEGKKKSRLYLNKKYKKTIAELTKYLNPIEVNLCSKQYDKINLNSITLQNNITYNKKLKNVSQDYNNFLNDKIENLNYHDYIKKIFWLNNLKEEKRTHYEEEKIFLQNVWENDFDKYIIESEYDFSNKYLIIDLSTSLLNNYKVDIFKIILQCLYLNNNIIINKKRPSFVHKKNSIFEIFESVYDNIGISNEINIHNINNLIMENKLEPKKYVIISEKSIGSINNTEKLNLDYIKLDNEQFNKVKDNYYEGNPLYYKKINTKQLLVKDILNNSQELNKRNGISYLIPIITIPIILFYFLINNLFIR